MSTAAAADAAPGVAEGWFWCPELRRPVRASAELPMYPRCALRGHCDEPGDTHRRLLIEAATDAPLAGALAVTLELASYEPRATGQTQAGRYDYCRMCAGVGVPGGTLRHEPGCIWVAAREIAWDLADGPHA